MDNQGADNQTVRQDGTAAGDRREDDLRAWVADLDRREDDLRDKVAELERRLEDLAYAVFHPGG